MNEQIDAKFNPDELREFYKRARNRLWKLEPLSVLAHTTKILNKAAYGGIEVLRKYQPWNVLLLVKWTLQTVDPTAHRRPPATLDDVHDVLNVIHEMGGHVRMPTEYEHVHLFMRHLAFQQFWLQHTAHGAALARQDLLFSRLPNDHPFQREFFRLTGVRCHEFTELAFCLMTLFLTDQKRCAVKRTSFSNLEPKFAGQKLDSFLSALSLDLNGAHTLLASAEEKDRSVADQILLPTPLLNYPLLQHNGDYIAYSPILLFRSLEDFIYRRLKRDDKKEFSSKFGQHFGKYVDECLSQAKVRYLDESALNEALAGSGKCVDFLITEGENNILVEAKGVEISNLGRVSHKAELVFRSIKESAGKAIRQGLDTSRRIAASHTSGSTVFGKGQNYLIVVTFDSLQLGSNAQFEAMFGEKVVDSLCRDFGRPTPVPFTHIFFMTIDEFERLLAANQQGLTTIVAALQHAQKNDAESRTRKFSFIQHLAELAPQTKRLPLLQSALDDLCKRCESRLTIRSQQTSAS